MKFVLKFFAMAALALMLLFTPALGADQGIQQTRRGEIVRLTGDIYVNEGTVVDGDVVAIRGNIYINGEVTGDAVAIIGDIMVNEGKVDGDAVAVAGKVTLGEDGKVRGDIVEALGGAFDTSGSGNYDYHYDYNYRPRFNINPFGRIANIFASFFTTLGMFLLAALVYIIMPKKIGNMADTMEPALGRRVGIGVLTIIASPIAMIILSVALVMTIVGILVVPIIWIAYFIAILIATVPAYVFIGQKIGGVLSKNKIANFAALAIGMFVIWLINAALSFGGIFTGWIGALIIFGVTSLGVGTLIDYIYSNRKKKPSFDGYNPDGPQGGAEALPPPYNPGEFTETESYIPKENQDK